MTGITDEMIERGSKAYDDYYQSLGFAPLPLSDHYRPEAIRRTLTAALDQGTTEPKEHKTMQKKTELQGVPFIINGEWLHVGYEGNARVKVFDRHHAKEIVAFIQQWLDHDPEQELRKRVEDMRHDMFRVDAIIAAVRQHDAKYGREK